MLLELAAVSRRFGGLAAVLDLTMSVAAGTIHGLIGPNGAGKSTVFNLISGVVQPSTGEIHFEGRRITGLSPAGVCACGIARTFQATAVLREFTVMENLLVASQPMINDGTLAALFFTRDYRYRERAAASRAADLLSLFRLEACVDRPAGSLTQRDQKALAIAMSLATGAKLLLLDEPFAGLAHRESEGLMELMRLLRRQQLTILLVEHDMRVVMDLCDSITVLNHGISIAQGAPADVRNHPAVIEAYLGAEGA